MNESVEQNVTLERVAPVADWRKRYDDVKAELEALMAAHNVQVKIRRIDSRPDIVDSTKEDSNWQRDALHCAFDVVRLSPKYPGHEFIVYQGFYSAGSGHGIPDTLAKFKAAYRRGKNRDGHMSDRDLEIAFNTRNGRRTLWLDPILKTVQSHWVPDAVDIVQSILMDATGDSFEDWCGNIGADTDSRRALKQWEACRESDRVMRVIFESDFDKARDLAMEF
jgi:hypothetical protein